MATKPWKDIVHKKPVAADPAQSAPNAETMQFVREWIGKHGRFVGTGEYAEMCEAYAALRTAHWMEECKQIYVAAGGDPSEANAQLALTQVKRLAEETAQLERELQDSDRMNSNLLKMKMLEETRAETAESALRDALSNKDRG
jgi:hypothetical protein